ncbi:hypothetical protein F5Y16DRAFT_119033 [Xylariaceae sp. FL0255]|nr:hypothetical protein F5Y16DRAFT_119033 [Xylariaceae sp. FL0255]
MPLYSVSEPHPTVKQNTYTHSGRGGAGNYFRAPATTPASGITTESKVLPPTTSNFHSGRGGAGNAHVSAARPVMCFDEEYTRQASHAEKRIGFVGRGGAGNIYDATMPSRKGSGDSASSSSSSSARSGRIIERISSAFSRN